MPPELAPEAELRVHERISARARHIRIELRHDGGVRLIYPHWVSRHEAWSFLRSRETWVRRQLAAQSGQASALAAEDGILLRGVPRRLCVQPARLRRPAVRFETDQICIFVAPDQTQPERLAAALRGALQEQARADARRLLETEAPRLGVQCSELRIRDPRTQWGSCTAQGAISLSWRLVMAPPEVFRYVVVHELCHRVHMDHSARFWHLVATQLPEYASHRQWLSRHAAQLHRMLPFGAKL